MSEGFVLVIGGTRGTGSLIARLLCGRGEQVRVLARNPARATRVFPPRVAIARGDITVPSTLLPAVDGARHIIFTAGCRSGYPVRESTVRATELGGVANTLAAARQAGFRGRLLYMTASAVTAHSLTARALNLWKGNTLIWRRHAESEIRASGVAYTIIRAGFLLNARGGRHALDVTQRGLPLSVRHRIARADVARVFVSAMENPRAQNTTFDLIWGKRGAPQDCGAIFAALQPDAIEPARKS